MAPRTAQPENLTWAARPAPMRTSTNTTAMISLAYLNLIERVYEHPPFEGVQE